MKIKLCEVLKSLNLSSYDILYVASSGFAKSFNNTFDEDIISALKNIMKGKTLIFPAFSFDFCDKKFFSVDNSKSFCGLIAETFRKSHGVIRSRYPPLHTVSIWGKLKGLAYKKYTSSFGDDSIFAEMNEYKCGVLLIDCSFDDGVPFVHVLEEKYGAKYRTNKVFLGKIEHSDKTIEDYSLTRRVRTFDVFLNIDKYAKEFYNTDYVKQIKFEYSKYVFFSLENFYNYFDKLFKENPNIMEVKNDN